ncbi:MAG: hypothetical protein ABIH11_08255, partial [Candidatus Altiarchaeota archaeon]
MRGQVSAELLVILGIALIVMASVFSIAYQNYSDSKRNTDAIKARTSLKVLKDTANYVYGQGEGASSRVFVNIPASINNSEVSGKHIRYRMDLAGSLQDVVESADTCVTGDIPWREGGYWVTVTSVGDCVRFGDLAFRVVPSKLSFQIRRDDDPVEETLTLKNEGDVDLLFTIESSDTQLAEPSLVLIGVGGNNEGTFILKVDAVESTEGGVHYETITVSNDSESFNVEVSILVLEDKSIELYPDSWMPAIVVGGSATQDFVVCNNGDGTAYNVGLSSSGDVSSWVTYVDGAFIGDIGSGNCKTRRLLFSVPDGTPLGVYEGSVTAEGDDGLSDDSTVEISVIDSGSGSELFISPKTWDTQLPPTGSETNEYVICNTGEGVISDVTLATTGAGSWITFSGGTSLGNILGGTCVNRQSTLNVPESATPSQTYTGTVVAEGISSLTGPVSDTATVSVEVNANTYTKVIGEVCVGAVTTTTTTLVNAPCQSTIADATPASTYRSNCIPFGSGQNYYPSGFTYKNMPGFIIQSGDKICFNMGATNDADIRMDIELCHTTTNGGTTCDTNGYTKIVNS